nr:hypothetical protein CcurKRNrm1_p066 [Cryptomonas curvata]
MKIKKGRISLKKEISRKFLKSENSIKKKSNKKKFKSLKNLSRLKFDPRPILTRTFISSCIYEIKNFLINSGLDLNHVEKFFLEPTKIGFFEVILFLIQKIDSNFQFSKKIEEDILSLLKIIKYPFLIYKSSFYSISSPHTWATLIACLKWITEVISYQFLLERENVIEILNLKLKNNIWERIVTSYNNVILKENTKMYLQRILWGYCVIKLYERKMFKKFKIEKNFGKKKKMNLCKEIWSLYLKIKSIIRIKIIIFKIFSFSIKYKNLQKNLVIFWLNSIFQISYSLNLKFFLTKINIIKLNDYTKFHQLKKIIILKNKLFKKQIKLNYDFFFCFFKNYGKIEIFSKIFFVLVFNFLNLNYQFILKNLKFLIKVSLKKNKFVKYKNSEFEMDFSSFIYNYLKVIKNFLKNKTSKIFRIRLLKDKIDSIFFFVRKKRLILSFKKKKLLVRTRKIFLNQFFDINSLVFQYLSYLIIHYVFRGFLNSLFHTLNLKKIYLIVSKLRSNLGIYFLLSKLIFIFSFSIKIIK